ncbi:porin [Pseudoalteromonas denitrificans]|uniref:Outer membrane protein (Porin) n=1 Tax=Pseudoalteromonas denitrificans DSM 6059 TaxID=1123010 RepID=A0A1I1J4S1_9GAMM|nr:porin [Pseudoalteromonas denitrificans]SFC43436.1 Outer membrane protein (porin) [Pseudoalteromonas denitrificans DSM 6059]
MKMAKTALAISLFTLCAQPVMAADVTVYGKANVTVQSSDEGEGSFTEIKSNASRFGLKGGQKLDDGLSVVYKLEWQVDLSDESDEKNIKSRNQYVGLKGGFGEVLIGRNDTALKQSQGKIDLFNDLEADLKHVFKGENRMGDSITYKTKKMNEFQFIGTVIAEDSADADNGYSAALLYGDSKLKKSNLFASIAMDSEVKGYDTVRATVQGKLGNVKLGAMLQRQETIDDENEADGFALSAAYSMGKTVFKAQYQSLDIDASSIEKNVASVGIDYKLAKNTKLFGFYSTFDTDYEKDENYLAVGMEYKF